MKLRWQHGLTLMELVVVLAILAAVTAAVSVATDRLLAQRRFEQTQATLDAVRIAVLGGNENSTTSQPAAAIAGFVADVGRLPLAIDVNPDPAIEDLQPVELWSNPAGLALHGVHVAPDPQDDGVSVMSGWRGPYLRMPPGATRLADGWGRSLVPLTLDPSSALVPATAGQPIVELRSLGSDNALSATGDTWSGDIAVKLHDGALPPTPLWTSAIEVRVWERDAQGDRIAPQGTGSVLVKLFYAHPTTGIAVASAAAMSAPFATPPALSLPQVCVGPKVVRAYWQDGAGNVTRKSLPLPIEVVHGGTTQWDVILPPLPTVPTPPPMP